MFKILRLFTAATMMLSSGLAFSDEAKTVSVGVNNWPENIAVANLWKILLSERGYNVKLQSADKALIYNGVAQGQLDMTFEVWLPSGDKPAYDRVKDKVALIGPWLPEANLGLAVPDYVAVESIDQLNANQNLFAGRGSPTIVGIDSGSSLMALTDTAKKDYQLAYQVQSSSEPAMVLSLERAIQRKEPIVVTLWKPHWIWSKYKIRYLKDPKGTYGAADKIYGIQSHSFKTKYPEIQRWLGQWKMDDSSLGSLLAEIIKHGTSTPEKGTKVWIDANRPLIQEWMR